MRCESIFRIIFNKKIPKDRVERDFLEKFNKSKINKFRDYLLNRGIYYPSNEIIFISFQTSLNDIKTISKNINSALLKYFS